MGSEPSDRWPLDDSGGLSYFWSLFPLPDNGSIPEYDREKENRLVHGSTFPWIRISDDQIISFRPSIR